MAKNVTGADIFGGMFQHIPSYEEQNEADDSYTGNDDRDVSSVTEVSVGKRQVKRSCLHPFHNHPFRVTEDAQMLELAESIRAYGVKEALLVRPDKENAGEFEIISGHRRNYAAGLAGLEEVPVYIEELDDDTAAILMVDSNNKREELLPSEKAWAYRIKADALRHQGKRTDLLQDEETDTACGLNAVAKESGGSVSTVKRYIRLTYLCSGLLTLVDEAKLSIGIGYMLSFFSCGEQDALAVYCRENKVLPNAAQVEAMEKYHENGTLDAQTIKAVMRQSVVRKIQKTSITFKSENLKKYFPQDATQKYMEQIIMELLERWAKDGRRQSESTGDAESAQLPGQLNIENFPDAMPDAQVK